MNFFGKCLSPGFPNIAYFGVYRERGGVYRGVGREGGGCTTVYRGVGWKTRVLSPGARVRLHQRGCRLRGDVRVYGYRLEGAWRIGVLS